MNIHIAINGVRQDPQPEEDVRAKIAAGEIPATALCWREGWSEWKSVGRVYAAEFPAGTPGVVADGTAAELAPADAEQVRRAYLTHEASVKSVGLLYLIGAVLGVFGGIANVIGAVMGGAGAPDAATDPTTTMWIVGVVLIVVAVIQFVVGRWLRQLNPKGRTPATIMAVIGLLGFPVGTLISAYILYLLQSKKGAMVFSAEYAAVMAATPHVKYKTSLVTWVVLGVLVIGLVALIVAAAT